MLLRLEAGGGDTLLALTCIWTRVGGPLESGAGPEARESIPSGGVIGLQNCDTLVTGAV